MIDQYESAPASGWLRWADKENTKKHLNIICFILGGFTNV
jgi:hypothetical protein